jgi:GTPase Era involved in 16S rRNA processing
MASSSLLPLTAADCPLLRDTQALKVSELTEQFNELVKQFEQLNSGDFAYLVNRDDIQGILQDVQRVRGQLTRPRYRVGFLGTSQAGKSTTFNNVLQEVIAQSGIGEATTSVITRFRRIEGSGNRFTLRFMTEDQYSDRREKLCKALHILNVSAKSNADILGYLANPQQLAAAQSGNADEDQSELARARRARTGEQSVLPDDIPFLKDFLRAYDVHGSRVVVKGGQPKEAEAPFDKRADYLNHASGGVGPPSENLLIWDAEIGTPNSNIPFKLEAIDCPGLGSKRSVDTTMTKEFLPHLDGALIFLMAAQLRSKDVVEILESLKANFGKLEGRVWVVINKFDMLTREPLFGDAQGKTVFDLIQEFAKDYEIPPEQIVLTSRKIFELPRGADGNASLELAAAMFGVPVSDPIPPKCKTDRILSNAFQNLLNDGGISHLRKLILETVSDSVSAQIAQGARKELRLLQEELTHKVETEQRRVKGGRQVRERAITCHDTVLELLMELGTRTEFFRPLATHLEQKLYEKLAPSDLRVRVIMNMTVDDLSKQFRLHAETLDQALDDLMNADVIDRLYGEVAEKLEGLPPVPVAKCAGGVHEAWQQCRREDRDPKSWRTKDFATFQSSDLFAGLTGNDVYTGFDGPAYLGLMKEKLRVATQQVMHSVRVQMRRRLRTLERELALLIWKPEENTQA